MVVLKLAGGRLLRLRRRPGPRACGRPPPAFQRPDRARVRAGAAGRTRSHPPRGRALPTSPPSASRWSAKLGEPQSPVGGRRGAGGLNTPVPPLPPRLTSPRPATSRRPAPRTCSCSWGEVAAPAPPLPPRCTTLPPATTSRRTALRACFWSYRVAKAIGCDQVLAIGLWCDPCCGVFEHVAVIFISWIISIVSHGPCCRWLLRGPRSPPRAVRADPPPTPPPLSRAPLPRVPRGRVPPSLSTSYLSAARQHAAGSSHASGVPSRTRAPPGAVRAVTTSGAPRRRRPRGVSPMPSAARPVT